MEDQHTSEADFDSILQHLSQPDDREQSAIEAVHKGDSEKVRTASLGLSQRASLNAKLEAVMHGKPEVLQTLLEENRTLSESVVAEALQRKDTRCMQVLLDFGWKMNSPIWGASPLW